MIPLSFLPDVSQYQPFFERFEFPRLFTVNSDKDYFKVHITSDTVGLEFNNELVNVRVVVKIGENSIAISVVNSLTNGDEVDTPAKEALRAMELPWSEQCTPEELGLLASRLDSTIATYMKNVYDERQIPFRKIDSKVQDYINRNVVATPRAGYRTSRVQGLGARLAVLNAKRDFASEVKPVLSRGGIPAFDPSSY